MPVRDLLAPRLLAIHALGVIAVVVSILLGVWQYDGWRDAREAEAVDLTGLAPIPLAEALGPDDPFPAAQVGRPITAEGHWLGESTLFVEGKTHEGAEGYWVVTPLAVDEPDDPALLIVRGWTSSIGDAPPAPSGSGRLTAWLQPADGTGQNDEDPTDDVLPQVRIADALQHVDQDLYGGYGVLDHAAAGNDNAGDAELAQADLAQLPSTGRFTALRNILYALQWWVIAGFFGFIWWRWVTDELALSRRPQGQPDEVPGDGPGDGPGLDQALDRTR